jgi:hypothetical protein
LTTLQGSYRGGMAVLSLNAGGGCNAGNFVYSNKASCKKKVSPAAAKKRYLSCASQYPPSQNFLSPIIIFW